MASCSMTVLGMYNYYNRLGIDLFSKLTLPEAIDSDTVKDNILIRCGSFEAIYSDAGFLTEAIGLWSKKNYRTFSKWITALNIEYNPLENYDRMEEWTDTRSMNSSANASGEAHDVNTINANSNGESSNLKSAFDSSEYSPYDKNINTNNSGSTGTTSTTNATNSTANESENANKIGRAHGNIGVTTSQQMLQSELDIAQWNIVEKITELFINEFCIPIY